MNSSIRNNMVHWSTVAVTAPPCTSCTSGIAYWLQNVRESGQFCVRKCAIWLLRTRRYLLIDCVVRTHLIFTGTRIQTWHTVEFMNVISRNVGRPLNGHSSLNKHLMLLFATCMCALTWVCVCGQYFHYHRTPVNISHIISVCVFEFV